MFLLFNCTHLGAKAFLRYMNAFFSLPKNKKNTFLSMLTCLLTIIRGGVKGFAIFL